MIPNRAMFYWSGGPLSWMRYCSLWSFRRLNPTWEIVLFYGGPHANAETWTDSNEKQDWMGEAPRDYLGEVRLLGVDLKQWHCPAGFSDLTSVHRNDLCRWGALSKFGGWFFDLDILFVDSMEVLKADVASPPPEAFDVAFVPMRDYCPTGFIGAAAGNKFTEACYHAAAGSPQRKRYRSAGSEALLGMTPLAGRFSYTARECQRALQSAFPSTRFWWLRSRVAYPWEWHRSNEIFGADRTVDYPETVAIHWYAGSRYSQRFNRMLTHANYRLHQNTFTSYVRDLEEASIFA